MKTLLSLSAVGFLASVALASAGCLADSTDEKAGDLTSEEGKADSPALGSTTKTYRVSIPINSSTLLADASDVRLQWAGIDRYLALPSPALFFSIPPRDGESCDQACIDGVIAHARRTSGKLKAIVRVRRDFAIIKVAADKCELRLVEDVEVDMKAAVASLHPEWESYDFLTFVPFASNEITLKATPCQ